MFAMLLKKRAQLDRDRDSDFRFHGFEKVNVNLLDLAAAAIHVRRNIVNVEFQRVGARLLNLSGIATHPPGAAAFKLPMIGMLTLSFAREM
jgi:hypothetical protein